MIQSLSYGAFNPSIAMRRLGLRYARPMEIDPVQLVNWQVKIDRTADPKAISKSLFNHALEQSEKGHEAFSDELLSLAASY